MEELVWVEVETTKANDSVWTFKGQILSAVFEAIVSNQLTSGYFKLDKVYWISSRYDDYRNKREEKLCQYGKDKLKAYKGNIYLRIEHLVSISPFDGEMELARFNKESESHLSVVTPIRS